MRASRSIANHNAGDLLHPDPAGSLPGGQTGTTLCGYPGDEWGWAVIAGAEIKLDFLSPGSRFGVYGNYGVGATAYGGGSNLVSPGLFGSGNQVAFGVITDGVYVNGSAMQQTTAWTVGGGFEYFWTRNFSSTIYGNYTEVSYNNTVVEQPLVLRWRRRRGPEHRQSAATACDPSFKFWTVGTHHDWFPLPGLRFAVDVMYTGIEYGDGWRDDHADQGAGRPSDRRLHRQEPGHHLGHLPRPAHLGRRRLSPQA